MVDVLRVSPDYVTFRFFCRKCVRLVVDDVRHAYWSILQRLAMFVAIARFSRGGHRLAAACHHRGHRAQVWVRGGQRRACALVGRSGTVMPSVGDGILRGGGGVRFFWRSYVPLCWSWGT